MGIKSDAKVWGWITKADMTVRTRSAKIMRQMPQGSHELDCFVYASFQKIFNVSG